MNKTLVKTRNVAEMVPISIEWDPRLNEDGMNFVREYVIRKIMGIAYDIWYPIVLIEVTAMKAVELKSCNNTNSAPVRKTKNTAYIGV